MSYATTTTKLSLAEFARVLGINPRHFFQIEYTPPRRSPVVCDGGLFQHDWQAQDQVGREQIAQAIYDAETMIEQHLQYRLMPTWEEDEWRLAGRSYQRELFALTPYAVTGLRASVESRWKWIISGGSEARTLIEPEAAIVWSDEDGDGQADTGTVTVDVSAVAATTACEVELYYPGHDGDPRYQIRPVNVEIAGLVATITFPRYLAVHPDIYESYDPGPASWTDDDDFLAVVDVYRHWNDPSRQATLMWEPGTGCGCGGSDCTVCSYTVQEACLYLRSTPREGVFSWAPGNWDAEGYTFAGGDLALGRTPDIVRLYYLAGWEAKDGCPMTMDRRWQAAVARLAVTFLDRPGCQCTSSLWDHWQEGGADLGKGDAAVRFLSNPFGPNRGGLYAWSRVMDTGVAIPRSAVLI